ncbi:MAG: D-alanyl-D-alanine carboxypeptidase [Peptococcaceae bacterium]|nr:D-alanyl-D-alanine carboxypeptidase [Peptococcaceae bacterium]
MKKKITAIVLLTTMLLGLLPSAAMADLITEKTPNINAVSYIVLEQSSGEIILGQNYDAQFTPGDLVQMMTAVLAIESGKLDETVTIGKIPEEVRGTQVYLRQGEKYTLRQLVEVMILWSANDVAYVIGNYLGNGHDKFVTSMNKKAQALGMTNTAFINSYGLEVEGQVSSAKDMAVLACYAMGLDEYRKFAAKDIINWQGESYQKPLGNKNQLLSMNENATGVKGGSAINDLYAVAGAIERDNMELVGVILGASTDAVYEEMQKIINFGFDNIRSVPVVRKDALQTTLVFDEQAVHVVASSGYTVLQQKGTASIVSYQTKLNDIELPIKKDQVVGDLEISVDGNVIDTVPLVAKESASKPINKLFVFTCLMTLLYIVQIIYRTLQIIKGNKRRKQAKKRQASVNNQETAEVTQTRSERKTLGKK